MNNNSMIIPSGVTFKFIVKPSMSEKHQEGLKYFIVMKSGLDKYYKNIDVSFFDGCFIDSQGRSTTDDAIKGKQMLVKVFCPKPIIAVDKNKEEAFYKQIKEKVSDWVIDLIQSNSETKYSAKLEDFLYTQKMM